jgi:hypothetical protein
MNAKKLFLIPIFILTLSIFLTSCLGGEELCRVEGAEYTYVLRGTPNAIARVEVLSSDGQAVAKIDPSYRVNEPWLSVGDHNYGFKPIDLDGDGDEDLVIQTVRTEGAERYLFYMNKGKGEYKLEKELSGAVAPEFGDGVVIVRSSDRIDQPTYNNEPPMYELRRNETVYGWSERGRLEIRQVNRFSYFSETDIYKYSVYLPDEEGELYADHDKWIYHKDLEKYGFEPLE